MLVRTEERTAPAQPGEVSNKPTAPNREDSRGALKTFVARLVEGHWTNRGRQLHS
jgi:hypothetical protein